MILTNIYRPTRLKTRKESIWDGISRYVYFYHSIASSALLVRGCGDDSSLRLWAAAYLSIFVHIWSPSHLGLCVAAVAHGCRLSDQCVYHWVKHSAAVCCCCCYCCGNQQIVHLFNVCACVCVEGALRALTAVNQLLTLLLCRCEQKQEVEGT